MRTRVKICGITRVEDARLAGEIGVDAIGLVFYAKSSRAVTLAQAADIVRAVPPFVSLVGLFLDADSAYIREVLEAVPLDLLQFHGDECPADCGIFGRPYIKAIGMAGNTDVGAYAASYPDAAGYLLDSHPPGKSGGTGEHFNWSRWPRGIESPLILAGGLMPENVGQAIAETRPYGVDVSSGVEIGKGIKDPAKIADFISEVRSVDCK